MPPIATTSQSTQESFLAKGFVIVMLWKWLLHSSELYIRLNSILVINAWLLGRIFISLNVNMIYYQWQSITWLSPSPDLQTGSGSLASSGSTVLPCNWPLIQGQGLWRGETAVMSLHSPSSRGQHFTLSFPLLLSAGPAEANWKRRRRRDNWDYSMEERSRHFFLNGSVICHVAACVQKEL